MAIMLGAIVENHLTALLRLLMRREKTLADEMFNPSGPLGPFGTKIRLGYMLRIISPQAYKDLIIVNKIRNKFAHDLSVTTFEDQQIAAWIQNMNMFGTVKRMAEKAKKRMESGESQREGTTTFDFVASNALSSMKDAYRDCLRYLIHVIVDYENAIKIAEDKMKSEVPILQPHLGT